MRRFNKNEYLHKLQNKNNKKTKIASIVILTVVLIGTIIFFSFARFESIQTFSLIDGVGYIEPKAILTNGRNFNIALKTLAGKENPTVTTYANEITSLEWSDTLPLDSDNAVDVADSSSNRPIYAWFKEGTIYINSELDKIYMNNDSSYMFSQFSSMTSLDLSHFDSSKVTNMHSLFTGLDVTTLDLSHFDTTNVTDMAYMFDALIYLESINVSSFNTSNVTNMAGMFRNNKKLINLDLSSFNTSKVTNMSYMFRGMEKLTSINLSSFDTSEVTTTYEMLVNTLSLVSLDLSSFNTSKMTDMRYMFNIDARLAGYSHLTTVYVSNLWNISSSAETTGMFSNQRELVGSSGTSYTNEHSDGEYARVDDPVNGKPGYFTLKTN